MVKAFTWLVTILLPFFLYHTMFYLLYFILNVKSTMVNAFSWLVANIVIYTNDMLQLGNLCKTLGPV